MLCIFILYVSILTHAPPSPPFLIFGARHSNSCGRLYASSPPGGTQCPPFTVHVLVINTHYYYCVKGGGGEAGEHERERAGPGVTAVVINLFFERRIDGCLREYVIPQEGTAPGGVQGGQQVQMLDRQMAQQAAEDAAKKAAIAARRQ
jgi:hypothetical protein